MNHWLPADAKWLFSKAAKARSVGLLILVGVAINRDAPKPIPQLSDILCPSAG
jgi:hypothetical protein